MNLRGRISQLERAVRPPDPPGSRREWSLRQMLEQVWAKRNGRDYHPGEPEDRLPPAKPSVAELILQGRGRPPDIEP